MYSFYGGRPGNSFIIITTYRSVADMVEKFKLGPEYTAVHYDEHVMINTINKNDSDNGKIYRRGYEFTNDLGGAEFIGTIVGPSGPAPLLEMTTIADVKTKHASEGYDERFSTGSYSLENENLVPGRTDDGTFNDEIQWACCSIRNENDEDSIAYLGFTFPYHVIDYSLDSVAPYKEGRYSNTTAIKRIDDRTHPYYEKWHIDLPYGIKGDAIKNFAIETASTDLESYEGQADDVNNNRKVLVYTYYCYDEYEDGNPKKFYLGDYNSIDNIVLGDDGTVTIDYTHDDNQVWSKKIKWIRSISLNDRTGDFKVIYNHAVDASGVNTEYNVQLKWVNDIVVAADGTVNISYTKEADKVYDKLIKWVTGITMNGDGTITIKWNNGSSDTVFSKIVKWIDSVSLANDGTLTVGYNNGATNTVFSKTIKWITGVSVAANGTLTVNYNNDTPAYVANKQIKWIDDITVSNDGTLTIQYNNDSDDKIFANKIKWLTGATLNNNGTFTMTWNNGSADTVYANIFKWINTMNVAADGTVTFTWNNGAEDLVYNNLIKWINNVSVSDNGTLIFNWNDNNSTVYNNLIKWISEATINTGSLEGEGNQKLHITWNDGSSMDIGNPINYIMNMVVNENNHLLVKYSDPVKRTNGVSYNGSSGWVDLGLITQHYEYNNNSTVEDLQWIGIGQLIDDGENNKKIKFNIAPTAFINSAINNIKVTSGTLNGTDGINTIKDLSLIVAKVEKTLTGLNFEIETSLATDGAANIGFINLVIDDLGLLFTEKSI